jgi:hypothetical protein
MAEDRSESFAFNPLRAAPAIVGEAVKDIGELGSDALELVYGKERTDIIEGALSDALKFIDDNLDRTKAGEATTKFLGETFFPEDKDLSITEGVVKDIGSFFVPYTGALKLMKGIKATSKLGKATKYGTAGVAADVIAKDEDEQYLKGIMDYVGAKGKSKEVDELVAKLDINPNDTVSERLLKQTIDTLALGIPTTLVFGMLTKAGSKTIGKVKAIKNKIATPVTNTANNIASNVKVVQQSPGQFLQQGKMTSAIAKINTLAGRLLRSKTAMPDQLFKAFIKKNKYAEAKELLVKKDASDLEKVIKKEQKGLDDAGIEALRTDVNRLLQGNKPLGALSQELIDITKKLRQNIDNQSEHIRDTLNLSKKSKLGLAIDKNLKSYITRSYEFYTNPSWAKKLQKGVRGETNDADTIDRINDMRDYLKKLNPTLNDSQIDVALDTFIDRVTKKGSGSSIIKDMMGFNSGGVPLKVLKGRKLNPNSPDDKKLMNFLGEVKDPYRNYVETMRSLNQTVAKAEYFKDIKKFVDENLGQNIKLGAFIPSLGISSKLKVDLPTAFSRILKASDSQFDTKQNLGTIVAKEMGAVGGDGTAFGLNKYVTTDVLHDMIATGIDRFEPTNLLGKNYVTKILKPLGESSAITRAAGITQAFETVFDHTAHFINTYGMFQTLASNGHIFRGKEAVKSAKTLFAKMANGDKKSLEYFAKAKQEGVVDSSVNAEIVRRNLDIFDEDLGLKGPGKRLKKAGDIAKKAFIRTPQEFYGLTDDFGKLTALQAEQKSYQKALNLTDDEAFKYAAEVVRNTMPSYTTAIPLVRSILSRNPIIGTYATFPAEILRTNFNIIRIAKRDIEKGIATGNVELIKIGARRLSGLAATTVGLDYAFNRNNEDEITGMGVTKESQKGINQLVSSWQKNTQKAYLEPIYEGQGGEIFTKYVDSGSLDANHYTKNIVKFVLGKVLAGKDVSETELNDMFYDRLQEIASPYYSTKFLAKSFGEIMYGVDENGRPVTKEEALTNLGKVVTPGTVKNLYKALITAKRAEEKAEFDKLPIASTASGYPIVYEDEKYFNRTGIRKQKMNVSKSVGYFLYNEVQGLKEPIKSFQSTLKRFPSKVYTQEDIDEVVKAYLDSQVERKELMRQFSDRLKLVKNIQYYKKEGDKIFKKRFGLEKILQANARMGRRKIDKDILYALADGKNGEGFFIPDRVVNKNNIITIIKDKRFPPELVKQLAAVQSQITGARLRDE